MNEYIRYLLQDLHFTDMRREIENDRLAAHAKRGLRSPSPKLERVFGAVLSGLKTLAIGLAAAGSHLVLKAGGRV